MVSSLGFRVINISFENLRIKAARIALRQQLLLYLQPVRQLKLRGSRRLIYSRLWWMAEVVGSRGKY